MITVCVTIMRAKLYFTFIVLSVALTACSQVSSLFPGEISLGNSASGQESQTIFSPTMETSTPKGPTFTPSLTPSQTLTFTPRPTRTPRPTNTLTATLPPIIRVGPNNFPDYINPLTGLTAINPFALNRRPIAVKVPNYPHYVYPQAGLSQADQIFEYHLEQGITRFIAIFYGNDALRVGPIRSGRTFDAHVIQMYNAAYVFNYAYREEGNAPLDVLGYLESVLDTRLFVIDPGSCTSWICRDESIQSYNNLFGNTYNISKLITQRGLENGRQDLATNFFSTLGTRSKNLVSVINVNYSYANYAYWEFDKATNRYNRYQGNVNLNEGEAEYILLTDANNGQPIAADNVVVLYVPHEFIYKSGRSEVFDIQLVDKGDAWVFRNGSAYKAVWERREVDKPLYLLTPEGAHFPLKPGKTFFQVIHTESEMKLQGPLEWTFTFERPQEPVD